MEEKKYVTGMFVKRNEKAPDFVVCNISIKADEFDMFVKENKNDKGYVNLQVLKSKYKGTLYAVLDTFEPKKLNDVKNKEEDNPFNSDADKDLPF